MEEGKTCSTGKSGCPCLCHKAPGILIALIGVVFLLGNYDVISQKAVAIAWPVLLILIGLKKAFCRGKCKCCTKA